MGHHTYREMFPEESDAQEKRLMRLLALKKQLEHIALSEFNAGDLQSLLRVMSRTNGDPNDQDMQRLEQKVQNLSDGP